MNPKATTSGLQVGEECRNYKQDSTLAQVCMNKGPLLPCLPYSLHTHPGDFEMWQTQLPNNMEEQFHHVAVKTLG